MIRAVPPPPSLASGWALSPCDDETSAAPLPAPAFSGAANSSGFGCWLREFSVRDDSGISGLISSSSTKFDSSIIWVKRGDVARRGKQRKSWTNYHCYAVVDQSKNTFRADGFGVHQYLISERSLWLGTPEIYCRKELDMLVSSRQKSATRNIAARA